ncbi:MAG: hypothetical protein II163_07260, partial [Ruminococcus sp.]|nr:hypothetical protein [Ruminococcus sp.]
MTDYPYENFNNNKPEGDAPDVTPKTEQNASGQSAPEQNEPERSTFEQPEMPNIYANSADYEAS